MKYLYYAEGIYGAKGIDRGSCYDSYGRFATWPCICTGGRNPWGKETNEYAVMLDTLNLRNSRLDALDFVEKLSR